MSLRAILDPAPRSYPKAVTLVRRAPRGREISPTETTVAEIEDWLLGAAIGESDLLPLFHALVERKVPALSYGEY